MCYGARLLLPIPFVLGAELFMLIQFFQKIELRLNAMVVMRVAVLLFAPEKPKIVEVLLSIELLAAFLFFRLILSGMGEGIFSFNYLRM